MGSIGKVRSALDSVESELMQKDIDIAALQAKIDALMLEYCPDEMTEDQVANWERHQVPATDKDMAGLAGALKP